MQLISSIISANLLSFEPTSSVISNITFNQYRRGQNRFRGALKTELIDWNTFNINKKKFVLIAKQYVMYLVKIKKYSVR